MYAHSVSSSEVEAVRITADVVSDAAPLPESVLFAAERVECVDGRILASGRSRTTTLAPEAVVHELRDADLQDPDDIVRLLNNLGLEFARRLDVRELGLIDGVRLPKASFPSAPLIVEGWYTDPEVLMAIASFGPGTRMLEGTIRPAGADGSYEFAVTLECGHWTQIAQRLRLVRAAVNHYIAYREQGSCADAWTDEGFELRIDHDFMSSPCAPRPPALVDLANTREADAWRVFIAVHAHLLREHFPNLTVWLGHEQTSIKVFALPGSLASALMVQLHNLVVDGLEIRRCANETCGRPFARQRGRARKAQYRTTGVIYCDAACAKAQMQREYRRRMRQRNAS
jgi:hypothetical protein